MSTLELVRLDEAGPYASEVISGGPSLCRAFVQHIGDFDFYALSPVGTGVDRLKRLNAGGLGGNLGTYKWVSERVAGRLGNDPSSIYVVPELWNPASDFKPEDREKWQEKWMIHDNELYYFAAPGDTAEDVRMLMSAPASFRWVGLFLRQVYPAEGVQCSNLMENMGNVSEVHVGAYGQESFVVAVRRDSDRSTLVYRFG